MDFIIRDYLTNDEGAILKLFEESFQRTMTPKYWGWRYLENPQKQKLIKLAWDNEQLAAHYALSPARIYINGVPRNGALSMTTMTGLNYRGFRLFTTLASTLYEENSDSIDVVYGVPNDNSIKGFIKYLDFEKIADIPMMETNLENREYNLNVNCHEIYKFDNRIDDLFEVCRKKYVVITSRTSSVLNWRYAENPQNNYRLFVYEINNKLMGYFVVKIFDSGENITGDIVDVLTMNTEVFESLLSTTLNCFKVLGIKKVSIWLNDLDFKEVLDKYGFEFGKQTFYFIVKDNSRLEYPPIFNFDSWYLTMGDIDIF